MKKNIVDKILNNKIINNKFIQYGFYLGSKIINSKFIQYGFCLNRWVWFHILATQLILIILGEFNLSYIDKILTIMVGNVFFELFELSIMKFDYTLIEKKYGSFEKYMYDTIGDMSGSLTTTILMLI